MSLNNLVKRLQDIMRNDAGINGDAQRIEQIVWILILKVYDIKEKEWALIYDKYQSIIAMGQMGLRQKRRKSINGR